MCQNACQGALVCGLIKEVDSGEDGEGTKIIKKRIEK
jgi:hypothetical protein